VNKLTVTGQDVLNLTATLIDEISETGSIIFDNPDYYKTKALSILTMLQTELLTNDITPTILTDINQPLLVSDKIAIMILPWGLASHLLMNEGDQNNASFMNSKYEELKRKIPTQIVSIEDVYGITDLSMS
jgi:hypothetical protein